MTVLEPPQISLQPGMASWLNVCAVTQMKQQAGMSQEGEITSRRGAGKFRRPKAGRWYFTESYAQQRLQGQTVSPPPTLHHLPEPFAKQLVRAAKGMSHLSILSVREANKDFKHC